MRTHDPNVGQIPWFPFGTGGDLSSSRVRCCCGSRRVTCTDADGGPPKEEADARGVGSRSLVFGGPNFVFPLCKKGIDPFVLRTCYSVALQGLCLFTCCSSLLKQQKLVQCDVIELIKRRYSYVKKQSTSCSSVLK